MYYGDLVYLRALESSDLNVILKYYNDFELQRFLGVPIPRSKVQIEQWIVERGSSDPWANGFMELSIALNKNQEFIGYILLKDIVKPHNRAELSISIINSDYLSKGYGTDALRIILWVAFNILGLHSVYLDTMADNERAIHVYEKVGFKRVGILRDSEFLDGAFKDLLYMDILREDFQKANAEFNVKSSLRSR